MREVSCCPSIHPSLSFMFLQKHFKSTVLNTCHLSTGHRTPGVMAPRGRRPAFGPRSFPFKDYPVQFPLSRPNSDNLQAICDHGDHRPRYPVSYFPSSGYGQQRRRAGFVNMAEALFRICCQGNQTWEREVTLCCATQAWEMSVQSFCEEDTSVKDRIYSCCHLQGNERLTCFHNDAQNPNYEATEVLPVTPLPPTVDFNFNPNIFDVNFPPGRPHTDTIDSLCQNQKLRPLYNIKCLPGSGYELLKRDSNSAAKGARMCLLGADQKWREEMNRFCTHEKGENVDFHCCAGEGNDRFDCFQNVSPDPHYNKTSANEELSLSNVCDTHKIIMKKFPVGLPLKSLVKKCCESPTDKSICISQREMSDTLCSSRKTSPPAVRRCCRMPSTEPAQCISKIVMDAVTKATNVSQHKKKKKRCPLS
uniref:Extracellular matrix protein 1b n=1 Tax=Sphaeramia orbicularis TaxID=375764 RepID=A0A672Z6E0_9TELE